MNPKQNDEERHPTGHATRLYAGLLQVKLALEKQGELGRMTTAWMNAERY